MKKSILILFALVLSSQVFSQNIDLHGIYGWQWGGKVDGWDPTTLRTAQYRFEAAEYWGVGLDVVMPSDVAVQLIYTHQETKITQQTFGEPKKDLMDVSVDYWQVGGLKTLPMGKIEPYGGLLLGLAIMNPENPSYSTTTKFAVTLKGGLKIWLTDAIGIKGELGMLMPMQWAGFSFGCGTGGCGSGVSTYTTVIQGQVGGGLVLRMGNK